MKTVYIDDKGNDKNDGLSEDQAVYTVRRAIRSAVLHHAISLDIRRASRLRLAKELMIKQKA
jgi:hypothetical protein